MSVITVNRKSHATLLSAVAKNFVLMNSKKFHKFTILNGAIYNREQVLTAIMKQVLPRYLLPFMYKSDGCGNTYFLSSNCWAAIKAIIAANFMVTIPELNIQIELEIQMEYSKATHLAMAPQDVVLRAFKKRVLNGDSVNVSVDVADFESDRVFTDEGIVDMFFPLWVPQFQRIIVQMTQNVVNLKRLSFSHNKISSLYELSRLQCPQLEELDLSYNEITWSDMLPILPDKVKHLWLRGNPLCQSPLSEYITRVKTLYPLLQKLDGVTIYPEGESQFILRNSFVNLSSHHLVDQFLHHYFSWFTRLEGRGALAYMYDKEASVSISCNISSTLDHTMPVFQFLSRNILRISDYGKDVDSFQRGASYVSFVLSSLPPFELDPMTTTVDVPYYIENKVMQVCTTGLFRDKLNATFWLGFTFLLKASQETSSMREWKIVNQMISFNSATPQQTKSAFGENVKSLQVKNFEPTREEILSQFKELTSMKSSWCENFLETANWDLESALQSFVDQYKGDMVSDDAFLPL